MLSRTRAVLGTGVPREWLDGLDVPASWLRFTAGVDRAFPIARHGDGRGPARLVARSASASAGASWAALARKSMAAVRSPFSRVEPDWLLDVNDPRSALHPVGGDAGRRAFFASVAEEARAAGE
jgi:hypothetical protein